MESIIRNIFDQYERKSRLYPALLTLAPLISTALLLYGGSFQVFSSAASILIGCGVLFSFANVAREYGKSKEESLFRKWGGKPTTQLLRHSDSVFDQPSKRRYHALLSKAINEEFPTPDEEANDSDKADRIYESGIRWLIERTRDKKKYDLIFQENIRYGYYRNMYGLKKYGFVSCFISLSIVAIKNRSIFNELEHTGWRGIGALNEYSLMAILISMLFGLFWFLKVNELAVQKAAGIYSKQLVQSLDALDQK